MSRPYLAAIMLISLVVTAAGGTYLYLFFKEQAFKVVPLKPIPVKVETPGPLESTVDSSSTTVTTSSASIVGSVPLEERISTTTVPGTNVAKEDGAEKTGPSVSIFRYRGAAKDVALVGDFNNWFRSPMKRKKPGVWETSLKLEPGTYKYMLIIDGKRTKDPGNKAASDDGKSIWTVKPGTGRE